MESRNFETIHQLDKKKVQVEKNESEIKKISKFRKNAPQLIAALATGILMFNAQSFDGFTTVLIAELERKNPEIEVSMNELTWIGSHLFLEPAGAILIGLLAQRFGSRSSLLLSSIIYCISWTMFYYSTSSTVLLISQGINALFPITAASTTYVVETSQPHLRSILLAFINSSQASGSLITVFIASFLYWRTVAMANLCLAAVGLIAMICVPNSPYWLTSKGKFFQAERSLAWSRGWLKPEDVKSEFQTIKEAYKKKSTSSADIIEVSNSLIQDKIKPYLHRSFLLPLATMSYIFTMRALMGPDAIRVFAEVIFKTSQIPHAKYFTVVLYTMEVIGCISYIPIVKFFGKRKLLHTTLVGVTLTYLTVSISLILIRKKYWSQEYVWVPAVSILFGTLLNAAGINSIVFVYNGELFPSKFRNLGAGIGNLVDATTLSLMNKAFIYILHWITMPGVFLFFSSISLVGLVTFYFILPETEGKTLLEIEEYYKTKNKKSYSNFNKNILEYDGEEVPV